MRGSHQERPPAVARLFVALALIASFFPTSTARQGDSRPEGPSEAVTSRLVEVTVQVTRDGEPVRGLTSDDFLLFDNGKRQEILSVDFFDYASVSAEGRTGPDPTIPPAARRHILLLFDLTFSGVRSLNSARHAAVEIVRDSIHPDDLLGVATYSDVRGAEIVLNFTSDRSQVIAAIDAIGTPRVQGRYVDSLGLISVQPDQTGERGSMADAQIREIMELSSGFEKRSSDRAQVGNLATGMSMLAQVLGSVSGRKDVIYLSEGFDNDALAASEDFVENARMNQAAEKGEIWNIDSQKRYGDTTRHSLLRKLTDTLQQAQCVVHSVDLASPELAESLEDGDVSARAGGNQGLSLLASETGGSYTRNVSQVGRSMERILDDLSVTYVLSFRPTDLAPDGEYHKLKVRLAKGVAKARVEHRPGYFAPRPASQRAPAERRLELTERLMAGGDRGSIPVSVIAVPIAKSSHLLYVPMFIEVEGPTLLAGRTTGQLETHILVYAFDSTGRVCDLFNHKVGLDLDQVASALSRRGLKFFGELYLRPGSYDVRVLVVDGATGRSQLRSVRLEAPDLSGTAMSVTPPLVPDPQGLWVLTRGSDGGGNSTQEEYPFQVAGRSFVPAAMPVVPSTGSTPVVVMTQGGPVNAASLRIRLFDAAGRLLAEPICSPPRAAGVTGFGRAAISTEMQTSGLGEGACILEVAIQRQDGETVTSTIPCVVGGANETPAG